jgi:alpha-mannosidase
VPCRKTRRPAFLKMPKKITIHLVCKAHIDPVWLWPWTAGLDEILNTCAAACDLLDRNPDVIFTRGEAWVYQQIEKLDPDLFDRIRALVRRGQWEVVGGWYLQPDCNIPHAEGFRKQIQLGKQYFLERFGRFPRVAFNVDSFGHAPVLPELMVESGQKYYVMMRPQEHEMPLPARLFRWRGKVDGPEVLTFRVAGSYTTFRGLTLDHIKKSLTELPEGVTHTMCCVGIGDHGGGPTQAMIDFCRENRDAIPGAVLRFSSPRRFFQAVSPQAKLAPIVTGELQHHAIGCYSVQRSAKTGVRRAEHALLQAEEALRLEPGLRKRFNPSMRSAWEWLCFNHFHDTLGGTCLPSCYPQMDAQLGLSLTVADDVLATALRVRAAKLPPSIHQRMVIGNYTGADYGGWLEHEPWLEWTVWKPSWGIVDENGNVIPHQLLPVEAVFGDSPRLLFKLKALRGSYRVLRIVDGVTQPAVEPPSFKLVPRDSGLQVQSVSMKWTLPLLELITDKTDTWSHGIDRYAGTRTGKVRWGLPRQVDSGPLLEAWCVDGRVGSSRVAAEIRHYSGDEFVELRLRVAWMETQKVLRLTWPQGAEIQEREDGVAGGSIKRTSTGAELPVHDRTKLTLADGRETGAVFPDTFSISSSGRELRLTLLRSAVMAHHVPHSGVKERRIISDQGIQTFIFRFYPALSGGGALLDRHAHEIHRRPLISDCTRGMPLRALRGAVQAARLT